EPLAAARLVENAATPWFDLGSGGGSPAIPMKIAHPLLQLQMVESRGRKAAFLREVLRELQLDAAGVIEERFERLPETLYRTASLVTVRAVRPDAVLLTTVTNLLAS